MRTEVKSTASKTGTKTSKKRGRPRKVLSGAQTVSLSLGARSYEILVERGLIGRVGAEIAARVPGDAGRTVVLISTPKVDLYYGVAVRRSLEEAGFRLLEFEMPAGEVYKTLQTVRRIYKMLQAEAVDRRALVVALGGGVIGDVSGFVAATYQRGLDFVQVPTTLLAQVDSSVGGKTGVNFDEAKNLIGAFYQPRLVLIDPNSLISLPLRERRSGLAEVIKYGIIHDKRLFELLEAEVKGILRLTSGKVEHVIARSCAIKARIVEQDERDEGVRAILNFGHTIGHALEAITRYRIFRHGEAIVLGMVAAALIGEEVGVTNPDDTERIIALFRDAGFHVHLPDNLAIGGLLRLLAWDKKSVDGVARFVLMEEIGRATPGHEVPPEAIRRALERQYVL